MSSVDFRYKIQTALAQFTSGGLQVSALNLLEVLGYSSDRRLDLSPNTAAGFIENFGLDNKLNPDRAHTSDWQAIDFLFQLTKDEISQSPQLGLFTNDQLDNTIIESYLFMAIALTGSAYTRTQLAQITREINKQFNMPVMLLFRYGPHLTISVINRRLHKRDTSKDVLEKVTLIKDINLTQPHRAHLEILADLALPELYRVHGFRNFVELHRAWQKTLDSTELNKRFFQEIAYWYFWAAQHVTFPDAAHPDPKIRTAISLIRLLTRLIFVWFIKEKGLIPDELFNQRRLAELLVYDDPKDSTYYKAILQNLFFATLNQEMDQPGQKPNREFRRTASSGGRDQDYLNPNFYRYRRYFKDPDAALTLFANIPFLNGGLFECLDRKDENNKSIRIDGFSDRPDNLLAVPDSLFFHTSHSVDLNEIYGTSNRRYQVRGLIDILSSYKFTVAENTPIEEEIALDPELLGRVFENLLAAYNEETHTTARKQTGSFYTPREVVDYMVDESLLAYFERKLQTPKTAETEEVTTRLRHLLAYNDAPPQFDLPEIRRLVDAIDAIKILDPAAGSGAFPMGSLHKLVFVLGKLDPDNEQWRAIQRKKALSDTEKAFQLGDKTEREQRLLEINEVFENNTSDYGRKLYLIENAIYGVDNQPIAAQIAKLRFFISLVVDQTIDETAPNRGIRPLPNLETKFVTANSLLAVERPKQYGFEDPDITAARARLKEVRHRYFSARSPATKKKYRAEDKALRNRLDQLLQQSGFKPAAAHQLAQWDPYDQNASANFFDPEWMFIFKPDDGFDIVIGNPPYVRQEKIKTLKPALQTLYDCYVGTADLYVYFFERGFKALTPGGVLTFISSNKYFRAGYGEKLRRYLSQKATIRRLIDFGDAPVFTAIAYPSIIVLVKQKPTDNTIQALSWEFGTPITDFPTVAATDSFALAQSKLTAEGWRLEPPAVLRLLERLRRSGTPLGDYIKGRFYYGIKTGLNEAFVVDRLTRDRLIADHPSSAELLKPFLRGRDVKRWAVEFAEQYLIKIESSENKEHPWTGQPHQAAETMFARTYPAIHAWFEGQRQQLIKRWDQGKYFWELRACAYWEEFEQLKILYPDIYEHQSFAWDDVGFYAVNTCYFIPTREKWMIALFNSTTVEWFYSLVSNKVRGGYLRAFSDYMKQIPIPEANTEQRGVLELLVNYILFLKQNPEPPVNPHVPNEHVITLLEEALNGCVFELYFPEAVQAQQVNVINLVDRELLPIAGETEASIIREIIEAGYQALREPRSDLRNRLIKQKIVVDEIKLITEGLA